MCVGIIIVQPFSSPQVNHLSPFLLTLELLPTLEETAAAMAAAGAAGEGEGGGGGGGGGGDCRVVWVASTAHEGACWEPNNIDSDAFHRMGTYRNSKLYNVSFSIESVFFSCVLVYT